MGTNPASHIAEDRDAGIRRMPSYLVTKLHNHTPHEIALIDKESGLALRRLPPEEPLIRCEVERRFCERIILGTGGAYVPLTESKIARTEGELPPPEPDTLRVVSRIVAEAHPDRDDLVFPDDLVRDETGQVIGCRSLSRLPR